MTPEAASNNAPRPVVEQDPALVELGINVIRGLAMDAPEQANWDTQAPPWRWRRWPTCSLRGSCATIPMTPSGPTGHRFVLSNGHASILLYSMLHLTGYKVTLEEHSRIPASGAA